LLPLILGVILALLWVAYKSYRIKKIPLKSNCLLTQHPIVFIEKPFSYLARTRHSSIRHELMAHGYQVFTLPIHKLFCRSHIFYSPNMKPEIERLKSKYAHFIASEQLLDDKPVSAYIDQAISLAELDFQCSH
jgi:hypothetical protein